jgi:hypothetical protein|tara:strand:- start:1179 stop:1466 length:288 start_codon:yes stop_codon:yes gene_type:complete
LAKRGFSLEPFLARDTLTAWQRFATMQPASGLAWPGCSWAFTRPWRNPPIPIARGPWPTALAKALDWVKKADNQGEPGAAEKVTAITKIMKSGKK